MARENQVLLLVFCIGLYGFHGCTRHVQSVSTFAAVLRVSGCAASVVQSVLLQSSKRYLMYAYHSRMQSFRSHPRSHSGCKVPLASLR